MLATQSCCRRSQDHAGAASTGSSAPGVTAKDMVLAIIGEIGTAGGTGHVIEFAGEAIRALSDGRRMTVCNMAIEAGARAGHGGASTRRPFDYAEGSPDARRRASCGSRRWPTGETLHSGRGRRVRQRDRASTRRHRAAGHLGHLARDGAAGGRPRARSRRRRRSGQARRHRACAGLHGPGAGHADHRHHARQGVHRLLHQLAHRRSARGRGRRQGPQGGRLASSCHGGAGLRPGEGSRPRPRGWTRSSSRPASNGASRAAPCAWP